MTILVIFGRFLTILARCQPNGKNEAADQKIRIPRVNISLLLNFDVSLSVNKKFFFLAPMAPIGLIWDL